MAVKKGVTAKKTNSEYKKHGTKMINGKKKTIYRKKGGYRNYVKYDYRYDGGGSGYVTEEKYIMKGGNILNGIEKKAVMSGPEPWRTNYILSNQLNPYTLNPKSGGGIGLNFDSRQKTLEGINNDFRNIMSQNYSGGRNKRGGSYPYNNLSETTFSKNPNARWNNSIQGIHAFNEILKQKNGYNVESILSGGRSRNTNMTIKNKINYIGGKNKRGGGPSFREIQLEANEIFRKGPLYYGDTLPYKNDKIVYTKNDMINLSNVSNMNGGKIIKKKDKNKKKKKDSVKRGSTKRGEFGSPGSLLKK